jgi:hypothetical protein
MRKVVEVEDGGKKRIVTVASGDMAFLAPLHHMIQDRLVRFGGVLRGDADPASLAGMVRGLDKSEVVVSGDYESATDNFQVRHSRLLLELIRLQSDGIPDGWWSEALHSLTGMLVEDNGSVHFQTNGQMMGNYLSFPLLCLTNLMTIHVAFGTMNAETMVKGGKVKINGDDIVFRCLAREVEVWKRAVAACGLTLSEGKTLVHKRFFSLNSTFFRSDHRGVYLIPVIRSASVLRRDLGDFDSLVARVASTVQGWRGVAKDRLLGACWRRFSVPMGIIGSRGGWGGSLMIHSRPTNHRSLENAGHRFVQREFVTLDPVLRHYRDARTHVKVGGGATRDQGGHPDISAHPSWRTAKSKDYDEPTKDLVTRMFQDWCVKLTWYGERRERFDVTRATPSSPYFRESLVRDRLNIPDAWLREFGPTRVASKEVSARLRKGSVRVEESFMIPDESFYLDNLRIEREPMMWRGGSEKVDNRADTSSVSQLRLPEKGDEIKTYTAAPGSDVYEAAKGGGIILKWVKEARRKSLSK